MKVFEVESFFLPSKYLQKFRVPRESLATPNTYVLRWQGTESNLVLGKETKLTFVRSKTASTLFELYPHKLPPFLVSKIEFKLKRKHVSGDPGTLA